MSGYLVYLAAENTLFPVAFGIILYQWTLIMQCKNRVINTLTLSTLDDSVRMMLWGTGLSANYSPARENAAQSLNKNNNNNNNNNNNL